MMMSLHRLVDDDPLNTCSSVRYVGSVKHDDCTDVSSPHLM
jgi:hypothetical protein